MHSHACTHPVSHRAKTALWVQPVDLAGVIVHAHPHPWKASQESNTQVICSIYLHSSDREDPPETGHRNMLWKGVEHLWDNTGQHLHQHQAITHSHHCVFRKAHCIWEQCITVTTFTRLLCERLLQNHIYRFCSLSTLHQKSLKIIFQYFLGFCQ